MVWGFLIALGSLVNLFSPTDPSVPTIMYVAGTVFGVWLMWRGYLRSVRAKHDEDGREPGTDQHST
jgi:ABC-type maltose transport system permease subunit